MIVTEIYHGQGLGNQLACYITTRVVAKDKGYKFGIKNPWKFKCLDFLDLDFGEEVIGGIIGREGQPPITLPEGIQYYYREGESWHPNGSDIRIDDPLLEQIQDHTKLDGVFQSENRIIHRKEEIREWLRIRPEKECYTFSQDDVCVINFRGGDYAGTPDFFLNKKYWEDSIRIMSEKYPGINYIVVTDDPPLARTFFPSYPVVHNSIGEDYSIIKNAYHLILSNSSFPYFPVLCNEKVQEVLAPKYWGRYNISDGYWHCGYNIFRGHTYIDREGGLFSYEECVKEFEEYKKNNNHLWKK